MGKIYCDSGADISRIISIEHCELYQFPYDSPHRPKKSHFYSLNLQQRNGEIVMLLGWNFQR